MKHLVQLRHTLHQHPEASGNEKYTSQTICKFIEQHAPTQLLRNIGGHGVLAIYQGQQPGPTVLFRCDMDAVPVHEANTFGHRSLHQGMAHSCGHDGHMAIISGLAVRLAQKPPTCGRAILLFQPAEENGQGAAQVVAYLQTHPELQPNYAIGLHNLPGLPLGTAFFRTGTFAAASKGMIISLKGRQSHAAHPERGLNPAQATAELIQALIDIPNRNDYSDFVLCTMVHVRVGDVAFGTSAGDAQIMATLRAFSNPDMHLLTQLCTQSAERIAQTHGLELNMQFVEEFPATINAPELVQTAQNACKKHNLPHSTLAEPNRWSEDFAHFGNICPSLLFGLGAGEQQPALHTAHYDFPDALIAHGTNTMEAIARELLQ